MKLIGDCHTAVIDWTLFNRWANKTETLKEEKTLELQLSSSNQVPTHALQLDKDSEGGEMIHLSYFITQRILVGKEGRKFWVIS